MQVDREKGLKKT